MGRSQETFRKKENIKKREQRKKEKEIRKENRSSNSTKGKSFEDMLAYVDENGNLTTQKPEEGQKKKAIKAEEILVSTPKMVEEDLVQQGKVNYYNDQKGWGFINDAHGERIFFLIAEAPAHIKVDDKVSFKTQKSPRGLQAFAIEILT